MPSLKKTRLPIPIGEYLISEREATDALKILLFISGKSFLFRHQEMELTDKAWSFQNTYSHSHLNTLDKIRGVYPSIDKDIKSSSPDQLYKNYKYRLENEPVKLLIDGKYQWVFKEYVYEVKGHYSDEQIRLLVLEDFDKERRYFEKLKAKFDETQEP